MEGWGRAPKYPLESSVRAAVVGMHRQNVVRGVVGHIGVVGGKPGAVCAVVSDGCGGIGVGEDCCVDVEHCGAIALSVVECAVMQCDYLCGAGCREECATLVVDAAGAGQTLGRAVGCGKTVVVGC